MTQMTYQCNECNKSFKTKQNYQRHLKSSIHKRQVLKNNTEEVKKFVKSNE